MSYINRVQAKILDTAGTNEAVVSAAGEVSIAHAKVLKTASGTCSTDGNNTLVNAVSSKKIKVFAFSLSSTATLATTCIFQSGAAGTELWRVILQAPTGESRIVSEAVSPPAHLFETAATTLLNLALDEASTIHYSVAYFEEA